MAEVVAAKQVGGGLNSDSLKELWCWLWAGAVERERGRGRRIFGPPELYLEQWACLRLQERLLHRIPLPAGKRVKDQPHVRLCGSLDAAAAAAFQEELETLCDRSRAADRGTRANAPHLAAMEHVLRFFLPMLVRLRREPRPAEPAPPGAIGPVQTFRFHAWLATRMDFLRARALDVGSGSTDRSLEAGPYLWTVLLQWIASLAPAVGTNHYFHSTWGRLGHGLDAERFSKFAAWLAWQARPDSDAPAGARAELAVAVRALAGFADCSEAQLRPAVEPPPPWIARPLVPDEPSWQIRTDGFLGDPLHLMMDELARRGNAPPSISCPETEPPLLTAPPPLRLTGIGFFGETIWTEDEPFPSVGECQDRMARVLRGKPARPAPDVAPRPAPPLVAPRVDPGPPPAPPKTPDQGLRLAVRPMIHGATEWLFAAIACNILVILAGIGLIRAGIGCSSLPPILGGLLAVTLVAINQRPRDVDGEEVPMNPRDGPAG